MRASHQRKGSQMAEEMSDLMVEETESGAIKRMNMIEAINDAMDIAMGRDDDVVVFGEDVGYFGGVIRATAGLQAK